MAELLTEFFTLKRNENNNAILNVKTEKILRASEALIDTGYFDGDETRFRITAILSDRTNHFAITIWKSKGTAKTMFFTLTNKDKKIGWKDVENISLTYFEQYQIMTIWNLALELGMKF